MSLKEQDELYEKLVLFKKEKDFLNKIYLEIDSLIRRGYDGPFMGEDIRELFQAVNEYKKWKKDYI